MSDQKLTPSKALPPWTNKKRLIIIFAGTVGVFGISFLIGGIVYYTGRLTGVFQPQSIKTAVMNTVMDNPAVMGAFESATPFSCSLTDNFNLYWNDARWQTLMEPECRGWHIRESHGRVLTLHVTFNTLDKAGAVDEQSHNLKDIYTTDAISARLPTTEISGMQQGLRFQAWVMALKPSQSATFFYAGGDENTQRLVREFIKSLVVVEQDRK